MKKLKVKALKYKVEVSDGFLEHSHGWTYPIEEIYIPSINVCFNNKGYVFASNEARNNIEESISKEIEIDKDISIKLLNFVKLQKEIENSFVPKMFPKK